MESARINFTPRAIALRDKVAYNFARIDSGTEIPNKPFDAPLTFEGETYAILGYIAKGGTAYIFHGKMKDPKKDDGTEIYAAFKVSKETTKELRLTPQWGEAALNAAIAAYAFPDYKVSKYVAGVAGAFFSDFGTPGALRTVVVMELMGTSASKLHQYIPGLPAQYSPDVVAPVIYYRLLNYLLAIFHMALDVAHLHDLGIVHNDIKPDNFLVKWDQGTEKPPCVKIADLGFSCFGCQPFYKTFEAYQAPRPPNNILSSMVPSTDDPRGLGRCTYGLTYFFASPWFVNRRQQYEAGDLYDAGATKAANALVAELNTVSPIAPDYQRIMVNAALRNFTTVSQCSEYRYRVMNDLHCLAMSYVMMAVLMSLEEPNAAIIKDTTTAKWLAPLEISTATREMWRNHAMQFNYSARNPKTREALERLSTIIFQTLREMSNIGLKDIIDAISACLEELLSEVPDVIADRVRDYKRTVQDTVVFGKEVASKKRRVPVEEPQAAKRQRAEPEKQ